MRCHVEAIILAAGLSTRMGASKLSLELLGEPIIARVVRAAVGSALDRVILVVGPDSDHLVRALGPLGAHSKLHRVENPHPEHGMSSSLRSGMREVRPGADGVMVVLADQPFLTGKVIDHLIAAFCVDREKIVQPAVHGRTTTPVIFPAALFSQLCEVVGDVGGRDVVNRNRSRVVIQEIGSMYNDIDLDTPADLETAAARASIPR
ncbi:MAG: nucleotidyltransferase family protein [Desulfomonile sp.]|nr:nucleotidyltransferase family protein [Desulfomonile sp.]